MGDRRASALDIQKFKGSGTRVRRLAVGLGVPRPGAANRVFRRMTDARSSLLNERTLLRSSLSIDSGFAFNNVSDSWRTFSINFVKALMEAIRMGLIVPSSNTTMETEIPAMLFARARHFPERFSFHSSRMRMKHVTQEELKRMDDDAGRCVLELSDARPSVFAYACLVAIMAQGSSYHRKSEYRLQRIASEAMEQEASVISSAGALIEALVHVRAKRISIIAPYMKPLTRMVASYIEAEGIEVHDALSLEVPDNLAVGRLNPNNLVEHAKSVSTHGVDALVLSACVQMPSLSAIQTVQNSVDIPVLSASVATVWQTLRTLNLTPIVPDAGRLLSAQPAFS